MTNKIVNLSLKRCKEFRYGENPHQKASFYLHTGDSPAFVHLGGKELSYNNLIDVDSGIRLVHEFEQPACVIIKHTDPCGVAVGKNIREAYTNAQACDPISAFGGVVVLNRPLDAETAKKISEIFVEVVAFPESNDDALSVFRDKNKKNVLLKVDLEKVLSQELEGIKSVLGGFAIQTQDSGMLKESELVFPTVRKPSKVEIDDMLFGFKVVKYLRSNAIAIVAENKLLGAGAGQTSRVEAVEQALKKSSGKYDHAVLISDGFFPFRDSIDLAAKQGVKAVLQPGGSIKDQEVIEACNESGMALAFSGKRAFRH